MVSCSTPCMSWTSVGFSTPCCGSVWVCVCCRKTVCELSQRYLFQVWWKITQTFTFTVQTVCTHMPHASLALSKTAILMVYGGNVPECIKLVKVFLIFIELFTGRVLSATVHLIFTAGLCRRCKCCYITFNYT